VVSNKTILLGERMAKQHLSTYAIAVVLTLATRMRNSQESKNIVKDGCLKEPLVLAKSEARKLGFRRTVTANSYRFSVNWDSECESAFQCKVFGEELSY